VKESQVIKRSVIIDGHKTSVSLEEPFWNALKEIASKQRQSLSQLVDRIDAARDFDNLSSAVRLFVLKHYQDRLTRELAAHPSDDISVRISN
jgi:predicted DNA-binding ribbon-helix-helix protein